MTTPFATRAGRIDGRTTGLTTWLERFPMSVLLLLMIQWEDDGVILHHVEWVPELP